MKIVKLFFFTGLFFLTQIILAQVINGSITDENGNAIEFASVFNRNNQKFVYSNDTGFFKLLGEIGDSLEIKHISFGSKIIVLENDNFNVILEEKPISLNEVVVTPKSSKFILLKSSVKKKLQYGLALNADYLFEIPNKADADYFLQILEIPIKFRKDYSNEGSLMMQLFKRDSSDYTPLGEVQTRKISSLVKEKYVSFSFENLPIQSNERIYIFLKRVVPNRTLSNDNRTLSVNPFIYVSTKESVHQGNSYIKRIGDISEWTTLSTWFGYSPSLNVTLKIIPMN